MREREDAAGGVPAAGPDARARREVESELEELADPEAGPALPSGTLAAQGAIGLAPGAAAPGAGVKRELLRLGWPVMLSMALVSIGTVVDRMMIGWLDGGVGAAIPLAAAGYATQFFFLLQSALFAVGLACVALTARAIGAREIERARHAFAASLQIALVVSALYTAVMLVFARPAFAALGAEPAVIEAAMPYFQCLLGSTLLLAVCMSVDSALRANKDTITPMRIAVAITAVKLAGNAVFIYGLAGFPRLGLTGAGLATLLSQAVGLLLFLAVLRRQPPGSPVRLDRASWRGSARLRPEVVRIAVPGVLERLVMSGSQLLYFLVLSRYYGTVAVAVYTVGIPLLSFTWIPGNGYAQACATLVGHALGARDPARAARIGWSAAGLALLTALAIGVPFAVWREPLAAAFTGDRAVLSAMGPFVLAMALTQPFLQIHFTLSGAHRGAGDTVRPLIAAIVTNLVRFALAWTCAALFHTPVEWIWAALFADHFLRALILAATFRSGGWIPPELRSAAPARRAATP